MSALKRLITYFSFEELREDKALRVYGSMLALAHVVFAAWCGMKMDILLGDQRGSVCWPMFPNCAGLKIFSQTGWFVVLLVYALLACAVAVIFLNRRVSGLKLAGATIFLCLIKVLLMACDFRFRHNVNDIHLFVTCAFLFAPNRQLACRWLVVLFYFFLGLVKLQSVDWLSGAALPSDPFLIPKPFIPFFIYSVIGLELGFSWLLLSQKRAVVTAVLALFVLYHLLLWGSVGYFFPLTMICVGSVLWRPGASLMLTRQNVLALSVYLGVFSLLQVPQRMIGKESDLTGEGRIWGVNMFDAKPICMGMATVSAPDIKPKYINLVDGLDELRTKCDPISIRSRAYGVCAFIAKNKKVDRIVDVVLYSKRSADSSAFKVIDIKDFCRSQTEYSIFHHNEWIQTARVTQRDFFKAGPPAESSVPGSTAQPSPTNRIEIPQTKQ
jgi:hypothetical protein